MLLEKNAPQVKLRAHIFNNMINIWAPSSFEITEEEDRRLAEKARLALEEQIPRVYRWFVNKSADSLQRDEIDCTRAQEAPRKKRVAFETTLPECRRGHNKNCRVEDFVRDHASTIVRKLEAYREESIQIKSALDVFNAVISDPAKDDLSHGDCRHMGDCLIALEGRVATHHVSTNASEWGPISKVLGKNFVRVEYLDERVR